MLFKNILKKLLGKENYTRIIFRKRHGYWLSLNNPKTFNEKIQHRKFREDQDLYTDYADKLLVRDKIAPKIGEKYLVPLLGVYKNITVDDIESLPNQFVIKVSNGGGGLQVEIVKDKSKICHQELCDKFNSLVEGNFSESTDEMFYNSQKNKILVEELLLDHDEVPSDWKFHYFRKSDEIIIQHVDRKIKRKTFYDSDFKKLDLMIEPVFPNFEFDPKPEKLEDMLRITRLIGQEFEYSRVDLYFVNGKVYFGEVTFCHSSGLNRIVPSYWDHKLGKFW